MIMLLWLIQGNARPRRKPRLALARICLPIKSVEMEDAEYWTFPLPPMSPFEVLYYSLILDAVRGAMVCGLLVD